MEYTVEIAIEAEQRLSQETLMHAAELGGVSVGRAGDRRLEVTFTVEADDVVGAAAAAIARLTERVPGHVVAVEVMTTAEQDRRLRQRSEPCG